MFLSRSAIREQKQLHYWYDTILAEDETEIDMNAHTLIPVKEIGANGTGNCIRSCS
jgi:hypothetical protein